MQRLKGLKAGAVAVASGMAPRKPTPGPEPGRGTVTRLERSVSERSAVLTSACFTRKRSRTTRGGRRTPLREMYPQRTPIVSSSIVARRVTNLLTRCAPSPAALLLGPEARAQELMKGRLRLPTHQSLEFLFAAATNSSVNFVNWDANVFASRTAIASRLSMAVTERMSAPAEGSTAV